MLGSLFFGFALNAVEHAAEDDVVQRDDRVPVGQAEEAAGLEQRRLAERAVGVVDGGDFEFQLRFAGEFHFGAQRQAPVPRNAGDAPEVEGFTESNAFGIAAAAAKARAADEPVEPSADLPQPVGRVPAVAAAHTADGAEGGRGRGVDGEGTGVTEDGAAGPVGISGDGAGHGPVGDDAVLGDFDQGGGDGLLDGEEGLGDERADGVFAADDGVFEAFGKRFADVIGERCDQVDPIGAELGGEEGEREDQPGPELEFGGHDGHNLAVGEDFGTADVVGLAGGGWVGQAAGQVADDVADGDGLALGGDPFGRDHDGKAFDEVAEDFKRRRTGADDHSGAEDGDGDAGGGQCRLHFAAGGEVFGEIGAGFAEAAKVDDAPNAGGLSCLGELGGERTVLVGIAAGGGGHGMDEIEGDLAVFQSARVVEGGFDDFDVGVVGPIAAGQFGCGANEAPNGVAIGKQLRGKPAANVAGDSGDGDATTGRNVWQTISFCWMRFARLST